MTVVGGDCEQEMEVLAWRVAGYDMVLDMAGKMPTSDWQRREGD